MRFMLRNGTRNASEDVHRICNRGIQRPVFNSRAVVDEDGGKLLNEDDDPRTVNRPAYLHNRFITGALKASNECECLGLQYICETFGGSPCMLLPASI